MSACPPVTMRFWPATISHGSTMRSSSEVFLRAMSRNPLCPMTRRLSEGALILATLPVVAGLPVLHSGTAPQAGRASPKSGPSG